MASGQCQRIVRLCNLKCHQRKDARHIVFHWPPTTDHYPLTTNHHPPCSLPPISKRTSTRRCRRRKWRDDAALVRSLASIHARRGEGIHTLGEIWRHRRLSCPTRQQLGSSLLGAIDANTARYIDFHVEVVGCRYCQASLADLRAQRDGAEQIVATRRRKYFQSSAGYLKGEGGRGKGE